MTYAELSEIADQALCEQLASLNGLSGYICETSRQLLIAETIDLLINLRMPDEPY